MNFNDGQACQSGHSAFRIQHSAFKWWEVLVMLQSSLPARLKTPILQTGNRITFLEIGSGGGSCAHGGRTHEARPNLILSAMNGGIGG